MAECGVRKTIDVNICSDIEFQEVLTSSVIFPDKDNPACNFIGNNIEFAPVDMVNADMLYYRKPVTPVWGFTFVNNRPIYDPGTSVNPEWPDDLLVEFVVTSAQSAGVNMERNDLFQLMGAYKNNAT